VPTTAPAATTAPPATTTTTAAADPCPTGTGTDLRSDGWPGRLSSLVGVDARVGVHPCYERFVVELGGTGAFPGWAARYVDLPVRADPSDLPVSLPGAAALLLTVEAWMPDMEGNGYRGPPSLDVAGFAALQAVVQTSNYEGVTSWALALDRVRPFRVLALTNPPRLVVDVVTGSA
jgi:hypothetical protein